MATVDILIPTCNRLPSLVMALTGVALQDFQGFHLILADQSDTPVKESPVIESLLGLIETRGGSAEYHHRLPSQGIAEQRNFLLSKSSADLVLYLDDDVLMEPWVLSTLVNNLDHTDCAFVGAFPAGLSFRNDVRPEQQKIEFWEGPVRPEAVEPGSRAWERWQLHRAANLYHLSQSLPPGHVRTYKVAWLGACVLYDRSKLLEIGGYSFWSRLPRFHSGEDVLVQNLLMRRWGGCGIIPSGTYFSEMPSTVLDSQGGIEGHALDLLPDMVASYAPQEIATG